MIRKRDFNNILTKSPVDMKLLSIMNAKEGRKKNAVGPTEIRRTGRK